MTRVVEISADAVAGVRSDVAAVRESLDADWGSLRSRARALGVRTSGFDDVLGAGDRLGTHVLPVVDRHLDRARALEQLRYGSMGGPLPVLDVDPAPLAVPFTATPLGDGGTTLSWAATSQAEVDADEQEVEESRGIGDWFADRWDDASDAVADGTQWVADKAGQAWETVTDAGAAIGDWWERTTADLGEWIDTHLDGVREFIGRHVAVFRFLADALRIVGWILVVVGAVLAVALAIIGAMGGTAAGAIFGFGVGAVPGGAAGAVAGLTFGLKILGVGFTLVSVGDFLDVAADWGEGKIDGQELVKLGSLELGLALTSLIGVGVVGKILRKALKHLPASWRRRIDDWLAERAAGGSSPPLRHFTSDDALVGPLANHIERAMPGRITGVNRHVPMHNGRTREVDIEIGDLIIQVKDENARALQKQIIATQRTTGRPTIGYAPGIPHGSWLDAARKGVPIARNEEELMQMIKEMT